MIKPVAAGQAGRSQAGTSRPRRVEPRTAPRRVAEAPRRSGVCSSAAAGRGQDTAALRSRRSASRGLHDARGAGAQGIGPGRIRSSSLGGRSSPGRVDRRRAGDGATTRAAAVSPPSLGGPPPWGRRGRERPTGLGRRVGQGDRRRGSSSAERAGVLYTPGRWFESTLPHHRCVEPRAGLAAAVGSARMPLSARSAMAAPRRRQMSRSVRRSTSRCRRQVVKPRWAGRAANQAGSCSGATTAQLGVRARPGSTPTTAA